MQVAQPFQQQQQQPETTVQQEVFVDQVSFFAKNWFLASFLDFR